MLSYALVPFHVLFVLSSVLGNSWVMYILLKQIYCDFQPNEGVRKFSLIVHWQRTGRQKLKPGTIHLLLLSFADFLSASSIVLLLLETFTSNQNKWIEIHVCHLFYLSLGLHRFLSPALLTSLAFDRFWTVCRPYDINLRRFRAILTTLLVCIVYAGLLTTPSLRYAVAISSNNSSICSVLYPTGTIQLFIYDLRFFAGFILPCVLMIACYGISIRKLWKHTSRFKSHIPLKQVALTCTSLVIFHILAWSPFWIGSFYMEHTADVNTESLLWSDGQIDYAQIALTISFLQPSFDWLLYVYLNRQLRAAPDRLGGLPTRILNKIYKDLSREATNKERSLLKRKMSSKTRKNAPTRRSFMYLSEAAKGAESWASSVLYLNTGPETSRRHSNTNNTLQVPSEQYAMKLKPPFRRQCSRSVPYIFGHTDSSDESSNNM